VPGSLRMNGPSHRVIWVIKGSGKWSVVRSQLPLLGAGRAGRGRGQTAALRLQEGPAGGGGTATMFFFLL